MRVFLAVAIVILLTAVVLFVRRTRGTLKWGAYESAESLWSQIIEGDVVNSVQVTVDNKWRRLSTTEYEAIIAELAKRRQVDVERGQLEKQRLLLDPWGRRYEIALRRPLGQELQALVWSNGPDRASGTSDDIAYPKRALRRGKLPSEVLSN